MTALHAIINVIKYCNTINIPETLIEIRIAVVNESMKIFKIEISSLLYNFKKILMLIYVDNIQINKHVISLGL